MNLRENKKSEGLLAQSHCKHLKDGFCKACKEDFMRDFSEPKVSLLAHLKKLRKPISYICSRGCTHANCQAIRNHNRLILQIEEAVLGVAQQIPSILEKYICKTCGKFDAIKSGELNQCAITKSLGKCPYQHCLGEMLALLGAKQK